MAAPIPARQLPTPVALIQRGPTLWMLASVLLALSGLWAFEWNAGLLSKLDRLAYPLLLAWFGTLFAILWVTPTALPWIAGLGAMAGAAYFVINCNFLLWADPGAGTPYQLSTLMQWIFLVHFMLYCSWPPHQALWLTAITVLGTTAPAAWIHLLGAPNAVWTASIWPIAVHGGVSQAVFIVAMTGLARLRNNIATLTADSPLRGDAHEALDEWIQARTRDLEQARSAAEAASKAKSRFLAVMSHELRTPLHAVLGAADLLRDEVRPRQAQPEPEATRTDSSRTTSLGADHLIETIASNGTHLLRLIEQILDISRIEAGRMKAVQEAFDVAQCAQDAIQAVQESAQAKGLVLRSMLEVGDPPWRRGDPLRLRQVLINLLANAVKFTEQGWVELQITRTTTDGGYRIRVQDTGPGIAPEHQARIFDAFEQIDNASTRRHEGAGLGLAIARDLVRIMGGQLSLESSPGQGCAFIFELTLPAVKEPLPAHNQSAGLLPEPASAPPRLNDLHVLLVEDDELNQLLAAQMLERAGARVDLAGDGHVALALLAEQAFDLVLMDWQMPALDGLETTRRLRRGEAGALNQKVPVIALTANAFVEDRQACLACGMNEVLTKPVDRDHLLRTVQRWALARRPSPSRTPPQMPQAETQPDAPATGLAAAAPDGSPANTPARPDTAPRNEPNAEPA